MTYFYVYSPVGGYCTSNIGSRTYCGGGNHPIVGGSGFDYPMDIGFNGSPARLDFVATSNIKSIRTTRRLGIACTGSPSGGIDDALQIEMFTGLTGTGTMVAKVLFAHAASMVADDIYNCYSWNGKSRVDQLAYQPSGSADCYQGYHTRVEATNINGYNSALGSCSGSCSGYPCLVLGTTFLYEFVA